MDETKDYVELLNLKEFAKIINILGETTNIKEFDVADITYNYKNYNFLKKGNSITVKCSDGKKLEVEIDSNNVNYGINDQKYYYYYNIKITTSKGDSIIINKTFVKDYYDSYKMFKEGIFDYDDLVHGCEIGYATKEDKNYHSLIWNEEENGFNFRYGLERRNGGYLYSTGLEDYLLSKDLNRIISINNEILPSKETIDSFNVSEEKRKLIFILNNYGFNEVSKKVLLETIKQIDEKGKFINHIKDAYKNTIIPKSKEILEEETKINEKLINNLFSKEEILFIIEVIKEITKEIEIKKQLENNSISYQKIKNRFK